MLKQRARRGPIGLDIGGSTVKMLQLSNVGDAPSVVAVAHCDTSAGDTGKNTGLERAIAELMGRQPFQGRDVVVALGNGEFQMKNVRLPKMPADELASAVEFEAQERFDFGGNPTQIRYLRVGEVRHGEELKQEVIIFAASDEIIDARLRLLESLKLRPIAIDIAPCAAARSFIRFFRRTEDANAINVFLDVGYRGTSIIVTRGFDVSFLKLIDVGGRMFNEAVAKALGTSPEEAAELRIRIMSENQGRRGEDRSTVPDEIKDAVDDAVRPAVERLNRDVQMCMRYFAVTFRGLKPESMTLVGGEAHEPSLKRILSEGAGVPCLIGHPLRGIAGMNTLRGRDRRTFQPAWAVAGGLALRGSPWVDKGVTTIELLSSGLSTADSGS